MKEFLCILLTKINLFVVLVFLKILNIINLEERAIPYMKE